MFWWGIVVAMATANDLWPAGDILIAFLCACELGVGTTWHLTGHNNPRMT